MLKAENLSVKVLINDEEKCLLDTWAASCNGKTFLEFILLPSRKIEKIYHFSDVEMKQRFLDGLSVNCGESAQVI